MRLIDFFEKQVERWNETNKCNYCFEFHAPLTEEALNKQQLINPCCVQVMFTRDVGNAFGIDRTYNNVLSQVSDEWEFKNFRLYFIIPEGFDRNNYDEVLGHDKDLSKSKTLEDLELCISEMELNFCEFVGTNWNVTQWTAQQLLDFRDRNYTGYRLNVSIRKRKVKSKNNVTFSNDFNNDFKFR